MPTVPPAALQSLVDFCSQAPNVFQPVVAAQLSIPQDDPFRVYAGLLTYLTKVGKYFLFPADFNGTIQAEPNVAFVRPPYGPSVAVAIQLSNPVNVGLSGVGLTVETTDLVLESGTPPNLIVLNFYSNDGNTGYQLVLQPQWISKYPARPVPRRQ